MSYKDQHTPWKPAQAVLVNVSGVHWQNQAALIANRAIRRMMKNG